MPKRKISGVNYASSVTPADYKCDNCGATGVKLWREYETCANYTVLQCADCAEISQQKLHDSGWESPFKRGEGDQIGWRVPAVPVEGKNTYWGYTSVPQAGCEWWDNLPTKPGEKMQLRKRKLKSLVHIIKRLHSLSCQRSTDRIRCDCDTSYRLLKIAKRIDRAQNEKEFQVVLNDLVNLDK